MLLDAAVVRSAAGAEGADAACFLTLDVAGSGGLDLLGEFLDRRLGDCDDATLLVKLPAADLRFVARFAEREAEAVPVVLDAHDLQRDDIAFVDDFLRVTNATVDEFGDVDQPFHGAG